MLILGSIPFVSWLIWGVTAGVVPSATMQSKDGKYVIIGGNGDSIYTRLMAAVGRPDMGSANPLYATNTHRCQRADEIYNVSPIIWLYTSLFGRPAALPLASVVRCSICCKPFIGPSRMPCSVPTCLCAHCKFVLDCTTIVMHSELDTG